MADLRYISLKERNDMITEALFEYKGKDYVKNITRRYHNEETWDPFTNKYLWMNNATMKNCKSQSDLFFGRYIHGYD
jgi:hypothetical protein